MNNLKQVRDSRNAIAPAGAGRRRARSQSSRWDFVNFAVFPDDHRQNAAAKLGPFLPRCALVRLCACEATRTHFGISFSGIGLRPLYRFSSWNKKNVRSSTVL